jgi:hypothetical protein
MKSHFFGEKKKFSSFFFVMPLDGCTSDVDSGDWYMHLLETNEGICRQCFTKLKNVHSFSKMLKTNISVDLSEKGSTGKRLLMSPESTSLVNYR